MSHQIRQLNDAKLLENEIEKREVSFSTINMTSLRYGKYLMIVKKLRSHVHKY